MSPELAAFGPPKYKIPNERFLRTGGIDIVDNCCGPRWCAPQTLAAFPGIVYRISNRYRVKFVHRYTMLYGRNGMQLFIMIVDTFTDTYGEHAYDR